MKISITQEQKTPCIYHTYQCYGIKNKYNTDIIIEKNKENAQRTSSISINNSRIRPLKIPCALDIKMERSTRAPEIVAPEGSVSHALHARHARDLCEECAGCRSVEACFHGKISFFSGTVYDISIIQFYDIQYSINIFIQYTYSIPLSLSFIMIHFYIN